MVAGRLSSELGGPGGPVSLGWTSHRALKHGMLRDPFTIQTYVQNGVSERPKETMAFTLEDPLHSSNGARG